MRLHCCLLLIVLISFFIRESQAQILSSVLDNKKDQSPLRALFICEVANVAHSRQNPVKLPTIETRYNDQFQLIVHSLFAGPLGSNDEYKQRIIGPNVSEFGLDLELAQLPNYIPDRSYSIYRMSFDLKAKGSKALVTFDNGERGFYECRNQTAQEIMTRHPQFFALKLGKKSQKMAPLPGPVSTLVGPINHARQELLFVHDAFSIKERNDSANSNQSITSKEIELHNSHFTSMASPMQGVAPILDLALSSIDHSSILSVFNHWASPFDITPDFYEFLSVKAGMEGLAAQYFAPEAYEKGVVLRGQLEKDFNQLAKQIGFIDPFDAKKYDFVMLGVFNKEQYKLGEHLRFDFNAHLKNLEHSWSNTKQTQSAVEKDQTYLLKAIENILVSVFGERQDQLGLDKMYLNLLMEKITHHHAAYLLLTLLNGERSIQGSSTDTLLMNVFAYWPVLSLQNKNFLEKNVFPKVATFPWEVFEEFKKIAHEDHGDKFRKNLDIQNEIHKIIGIDKNSISSPSKKENLILLAQAMGASAVVDLVNDQTRDRFISPALQSAISLFLDFIKEGKIKYEDEWNAQDKKMQLKTVAFSEENKDLTIADLKANWKLKIKYNHELFTHVPFDTDRLWEDLLEDALAFHEKEIAETATKNWKRSDDKLWHQHPIIGKFPWLVSAGFRKTLGPLMVDTAQKTGEMINQLSKKYSNNNWERMGFALAVGGASTSLGLAAPWITKGLSAKTLLKLGAGVAFYEVYNASGLAEKVARLSQQFSDTGMGMLGLATNALLVGAPLLLTRNIGPETFKYLAPRWLAMNSVLGSMSTLDHYADYLLEHEDGDFVSFVTAMPGSIFGHFGRTSINSAPYMLGLMFVGGRYRAIAVGSELADFHQGIFAAMDEFKETNNHKAFYARSGAVILDLGEIGPTQIAHKFMQLKRALMDMNVARDPVLTKLIGQADKKDFDREVLPMIIEHLVKDVQTPGDLNSLSQRLALNSTIPAKAKKQIIEGVNQANNLIPDLSEKRSIEEEGSAYSENTNEGFFGVCYWHRADAETAETKVSIDERARHAIKDSGMALVPESRANQKGYFWLNLNAQELPSYGFSSAEYLEKLQTHHYKLIEWALSYLAQTNVSLISVKTKIDLAIKVHYELGDTLIGKRVVNLLLKEAGFSVTVIRLLTSSNLLGHPKKINVEPMLLDNPRLEQYVSKFDDRLSSGNNLTWKRSLYLSYGQSALMALPQRLLLIDHFLNSVWEFTSQFRVELNRQQIEEIILAMEKETDQEKLAAMKSLPRAVANQLIQVGLVDGGISRKLLQKLGLNGAQNASSEARLIDELKFEVEVKWPDNYFGDPDVYLLSGVKPFMSLMNSIALSSTSKKLSPLISTRVSINNQHLAFVPTISSALHDLLYIREIVQRSQQAFRPHFQELSTNPLSMNLSRKRENQDTGNMIAMKWIYDPENFIPLETYVNQVLEGVLAIEIFNAHNTSLQDGFGAGRIWNEFRLFREQGLWKQLEDLYSYQIQYEIFYSAVPTLQWNLLKPYRDHKNVNINKLQTDYLSFLNDLINGGGKDLSDEVKKNLIRVEVEKFLKAIDFENILINAAND
jgi:hypothetical protein